MPDTSAPLLFPPTRWTLLKRVREGGAEDAKAALETLCRAYWKPLYCVARQKQLPTHDAQDAVQSFFESILRREVFTMADETAGKLRNLLLRSFDNFCAQRWIRDHRQKRGGRTEHVELGEFLDCHAAEKSFLAFGGESVSIEVLYNREWARAVLERSLTALREDYARRGWLERYDLLVGPLLQQSGEGTLEQLAMKAGTTHGALRVTLHRMRGHFRDKIEQELAITLDSDDPALIRAEQTELFKAFA
ncbi:MAG: hypothetical protein JSR64_06925 [Nitrospira sp.]|nr:hypothetical protein [Nitrospira sp.]